MAEFVEGIGTRRLSYSIYTGKPMSGILREAGGIEMPMILTAEDLTQRMKLHPKEQQIFLFNVMKGATTAVAGYALYTIVLEMSSGHWQFSLRLAFWLVSLAASILTSNATNVFSNIMIYQPSWKDTVVIFAKSQMEILLFWILAAPEQGRSPWHHWILVYALWSLVCHMKLRHIVSHLNIEHYSANLRDMISTIKTQTETLDKRASLISSIGATVVWGWLTFGARLPIIHEYTPKPDNWVVVITVALVTGFTMVKAMETAEKARRLIYATLSRLSEPGEKSLKSVG